MLPQNEIQKYKNRETLSGIMLLIFLAFGMLLTVIWGSISGLQFKDNYRACNSEWSNWELKKEECKKEAQKILLQDAGIGTFILMVIFGPLVAISGAICLHSSSVLSGEKKRRLRATQSQLPQDTNPIRPPKVGRY